MKKVVSTGINGLDKVLGGGYPDDTLTLITGGPGTGKSIMGMQYLYNGLKKGDKGLYISFEEDKNIILKQAKGFGWDFEKFEKKGNLKIITFDMSKTHVVHVVEEITKVVKDFRPKRLVLDSVSVLSLFAEVAAGVELAQALSLDLEQLKLSEDVLTIGAVMGLLSRIKSYDNTSLIIAEIPEGKKVLSRDSYTEFICDGVIKLEKNEKTGKREMTVVKMRTSNHRLTPFAFKIGKNGISI